MTENEKIIGIISGIPEYNIRLMEGVFRCRKCQTLISIKQPDESEDIVIPLECQKEGCVNKTQFDLVSDNEGSKFITEKFYFCRISEDEKPFMIILREQNLIDKTVDLEPHQKVILSGTQKYQHISKKANTFRKIMIVDSIELLGIQEQIIPKSKKDKIRYLRNLIKTLQEDNKAENMISLTNIQLKAAESGIMPDIIAEMVQILKSSGEIIEPKEGYLRVV